MSELATWPRRRSGMSVSSHWAMSTNRLRVFRFRANLATCDQSLDAYRAARLEAGRKSSCASTSRI